MSSRAVQPQPPWVGAEGRLPLPWLERPLRQALTQKGHALLMHGPQGLGLFEWAMVVAQSWLCEGPDRPNPVACGRCEACHLLQAGVHPDIMVLVPQALRESLGLSVAIDEGEGATASSRQTPSGGREIRVADVRHAIDWGHQTSSRGRGKVLVMFPVDALNKVAANALLKTLEEPAGTMRLVLSAFDPQALLPTLRSRCQQLAMDEPERDVSMAWLQEQGLDAPDTLLAGAGGRPLEVLALAREGLDARLWPELPAAVQQGRADLFQGLSMHRVVDTLQKVCLDLMSRAQGAPARYFPAEALPTGARAEALAAWWLTLQRTARHEDHPWNAGLLVESLVLQGRRCWPARESRKPHVR